eukprot:TRINITY_DN15184_c0_g4_i1.p1 TRINITY_DN15184_c0_g4~~TRINITY_DN15184_c0_g4_i1.p1  ORF type:complete len:226 (+),score=77.67 TRINITY_DN15184_c0_g4_i1:25-678(+)
MIRRPPRSTHCISSAASDVYKRQEQEAQLAIDAGIVPELGRLLDIDEANVRKVVVWGLSNVTAGSAKQIQVVLESGAMEKVIKMAAKDSPDIRRECIWTISNASSGASPEQAEELVRLGAAEALCWMLNAKDAQTLSTTLEGIKCLLRKAATYSSESDREALQLRIELCGGLKLIEKLQAHPNPQIYQKALNVIEEYFGVENEMLIDPVDRISIFDF